MSERIRRSEETAPLGALGGTAAPGLPTTRREATATADADVGSGTCEGQACDVAGPAHTDSDSEVLHTRQAHGILHTSLALSLMPTRVRAHPGRSGRRADVSSSHSASRTSRSSPPTKRSHRRRKSRSVGSASRGR